MKTLNLPGSLIVADSSCRSARHSSTEVVVVALFRTKSIVLDHVATAPKIRDEQRSVDLKGPILDHEHGRMDPS